MQNNVDQRLLTTFNSLLVWIVDQFLANRLVFTVSDVIAFAVGDAEQFSHPQSRRVYRNLLRQRLDVLKALGCLTVLNHDRKNPVPYEYALSPDAIEIIRTAAAAERVQNLIDYFAIREPRQTNGNTQPVTKRHNFALSEKAGQSKDANRTNKITYTAPDGAVWTFDTVEAAAEFHKRSGFTADATPAESFAEEQEEDEGVELITMNATIGVAMRNFATSFRDTINELHDESRHSNKKISARFLSIAMAQIYNVIAGLKYSISYDVCLNTDSLPCNAPACDYLCVEDKWELYIHSYMNDLHDAAKVAASTPDGQDIELPTLAANGVKSPGGFRCSPHQVTWDYRGVPIPEHLLAEREQMLEKAGRQRAEKVSRAEAARQLRQLSAVGRQAGS